MDKKDDIKKTVLLQGFINRLEKIKEVWGNLEVLDSQITVVDGDKLYFTVNSRSPFNG